VSLLLTRTVAPALPRSGLIAVGLRSARSCRVGAPADRDGDTGVPDALQTFCR